MRINLRRSDAGVTEEILGFLQRPARIKDVRRKSVPELMRPGRRIDARPPGRCTDQVVDRVQPHRRAHRAAEHVHEHEITRTRGRDGHPLKLIGVERLHRQ